MPAGLDVYTADVAEITTEGSVRSCLHQSAAVKDDCGGCDAPQQPRLPPLGVQSAVVKSSAAHSSNAAVSAQSAILRINPSGSIAYQVYTIMKPTQSIACGSEYLRQSSRARQGKARRSLRCCNANDQLAIHSESVGPQRQSEPNQTFRVQK